MILKGYSRVNSFSTASMGLHDLWLCSAISEKKLRIFLGTGHGEFELVLPSQSLARKRPGSRA